MAARAEEGSARGGGVLDSQIFTVSAFDNLLAIE
jgi:hypothetical protein